MSQKAIDTPEALLEELRKMKQELFSAAVIDEVKKLDEDERTEFVAKRLQLSEAITRLETAQLQEIRERLQELGNDLTDGLVSLTESLKKIEKAAQWAKGLGNVLGMVSKLVPLG